MCQGVSEGSDVVTHYSYELAKVGVVIWCYGGVMAGVGGGDTVLMKVRHG